MCKGRGEQASYGHCLGGEAGELELGETNAVALVMSLAHSINGIYGIGGIEGILRSWSTVVSVLNEVIRNMAGD